MPSVNHLGQANIPSNIEASKYRDQQAAQAKKNSVNTISDTKKSYNSHLQKLSKDSRANITFKEVLKNTNKSSLPKNTTALKKFGSLANSGMQQVDSNGMDIATKKVAIDLANQLEGILLSIAFKASYDPEHASFGEQIFREELIGRTVEEVNRDNMSPVAIQIYEDAMKNAGDKNANATNKNIK